MEEKPLLITKRNKNYIKNSEYNSEKIKKEVERMINEKITYHPNDRICRSTSIIFPEQSHIALELPGIFKMKKNTDFITSDGKHAEMDFLEEVAPDGLEIFVNTLIDCEFESKPLTFDKKNQIVTYSITAIITEGLPCIPLIITNDVKIVEEFHYFNSHSVLLKHKLYDEKYIYKTLNTLSEKDYTKVPMNDIDGIKLIYCIGMTKNPYAQDFIEKSANLFASINYINPKIEKQFYLALKLKIKYEFEGEKEKELLTMITKAIDWKAYEKLSVEEQYRIHYEQNAEALEKTYKRYEKIKNKEIEEKDKKITQQGKTIKELLNIIKTSHIPIHYEN